MQCPFCQQDMTCIDNAQELPRLSMLWVCKHCPKEVRVLAEKDVETEQHWIIKRTSIFVWHDDKEYCLYWDYSTKDFHIWECSTSTGAGEIFHSKVMPTTITPDNAYDKFLTYLIWS